MPETEFRLLTAEELKNLYENQMRRDFPPAELKPLPRLLALLERGDYEPYALFGAGRLLAYALYWRTKGDPWVMLDYFAVAPGERGKGIGSALLRDMLGRFCQNGGGVFGEVEVPDTGDAAVDLLRRRRLAFYARAGLRTMGFMTRIFDVPYLVLAYGPEISDAELMETARRLYRTAFPERERFEKNILIPWKER